MNSMDYIACADILDLSEREYHSLITYLGLLGYNIDNSCLQKINTVVDDDVIIVWGNDVVYVTWTYLACRLIISSKSLGRRVTIDEVKQYIALGNFE